MSSVSQWILLQVNDWLLIIMMSLMCYYSEPACVQCSICKAGTAPNNISTGCDPCGSG